MKTLKSAVFLIYIFSILTTPLLVYGGTYFSEENTPYYGMIDFSKGDRRFIRNTELKGDFYNEAYINSLIDQKYNEIKEEMKEQNILVKEIKFSSISCDENNKCEINIVASTEEIKK